MADLLDVQIEIDQFDLNGPIRGRLDRRLVRKLIESKTVNESKDDGLLEMVAEAKDDGKLI